MRLQCGSGKFNFNNICPSDLGNRQINPRGWRWMSVTLLMECIGYLPLHFAIFFRIQLVSSLISWIITIFIVIGCFAGTISAIIPEDRFFKIHFLSGTFFFVGFGSAFLISMGFVTVRIITEQSWPPLGLSLVLFIPIFILAVFLLGRLVQKRGIFGNMFVEEWLLFILILFWNFVWTLLVEFLP